MFIVDIMGPGDATYAVVDMTLGLRFLSKRKLSIDRVSLSTKSVSDPIGNLARI